MTPIEQIIFLLKAVPVTLAISFLSFLIGLGLGISLAFMRVFGSAPLRYLSDSYEKFFRSVPVLAVMLLLYFGVGPYIQVLKDPFFTSVISLGIISGANQSQIFRSAIGSVGRTQMLAALSIGLTQFKSLRYVILPQALFLAVPGLGSEIALLIKDSAYSFIIGVIELMKYTDILRASQRSLVLPYISSAIIYVVMTFPVATFLDKWGSRKKRELGL